jgi:translation initiation factor IF-2
MKDWNGQSIDAATPGMPAKVLGFKIAPAVGDIAQVPADASTLKKVQKRMAVGKQGDVVSVQKEEEGVESRKVLNIVLKADALGSLEALTGTIEKMRTPDVAAVVISKGLGNVSETDVARAETSKGIVLAFNVNITREANVASRERGIVVKQSKIIYELFDEIKRRLQDILPTEIIKTDLGKLEVLAHFRADKTGQVIGGRVTDGHLEPNASVVIWRGADPVDEGKIIMLQSGKQEVKEVRAGQECGLKVSCRRPIMPGDRVEVFTVIKKERKLVLPI